MMAADILRFTGEDGVPQALVKWRAPAVPDHLPIHLLHRGHDGTIAFTGKDRDEGFGVASLPASDLTEVFPEFLAPLLDADSYYSVNGQLPSSCIHSGPRLPKGARAHPSMRRAVWGTEKLRWLTACWCDLDFYNNPGWTLGRAVGAVIDAEEAGQIPRASMLVDSGRGLWVFWVLRSDERPDHPVRAWPEALGTWNRIQRELQRRLNGIEPDYGATDAARVSRVPGSLNTKVNKRTRWWVQGDESGPFTYRLDELAALVDVRPTRLPPSVREKINPARRHAGKRGYQALNQRRLERIETLLVHRGKISEGCRARFLTLMAQIMQGCRIERTEIAERLFTVGTDHCEPPMPDDEITGALRSGLKLSRIADPKIGDWLLITPEESELVGWPAKGAHDHNTDAPRTRADKRRHRESLILAMLRETGGEVPTLERIREWLDEQGADAALATISADLRRLGIGNPRGREADADQPLLS